MNVHAWINREGSGRIWPADDGWRGYSYKDGKYYFHDLPETKSDIMKELKIGDTAAWVILAGN